MSSLERRRAALSVVAALLAFPLLASSARADAKLAAEVARTNAFISTSGTTPPIFDIVSTSQPCWGRMGLRTVFQPLADRWANVPFPCYFQPADGTDGEAVILDQVRAMTYEFWSTKYNDPAFPWRWSARWGGADADANFVSSAGTRVWARPGGAAYGVQASGLAFVPGVVRVADLKAGAIRHPVQLLVPNSCTTWRPPATRTDAVAGGTPCFEYGTKYRLPAAYNCSTLTRRVPRMLCVAARDYYLIVSDQTHSGVGFRFENWKRAWSSWGAGTTPVNPYSDPARRPALDFFDCDGLLNGQPVTGTEWDCYPDKANLLKGFPWDALVEINPR